MTLAADLVAQLEAIDQDARSQMLGPLAKLRALPDYVPPPPPPPPTPEAPLHGADPAKVTRTIRGDVTATNGMTLEGVRVEGRILHGNARDVRIKNVVATGGTTLPTSPRPIIDGSASGCEGWVLDGVTVEPQIRSVMWSDGVRVGRLATIRRLLVRGTVDGLAVVTPTGRRTGFDLDGYLGEDLFWSATDPNHADGTHNDGIQFHGLIDGVKMRRLILLGGTKGTSGIMANVASVCDFHLSESVISGGRSGAGGVNFGPTTKVTGSLAVVDTKFNCPVDVYASDALAAVLRLDRSTKANGSPATRTRS